MSDDITLDKIVNGLTPDLIPFKIGEYREEFEALKIQYAEENDIDIDDEDEMADIDETVFRAFVMHKIAALESVLTYVVGFLSEES
jgi:hypothetical protein